MPEKNSAFIKKIIIDVVMGNEKYFDVTAHMRCMDCGTQLLHVHLNFQEKYDGFAYDVSHIPKESDYVSHHCQLCDTITVFKISEIKSIRIRVRGQDVLTAGDAQ